MKLTDPRIIEHLNKGGAINRHPWYEYKHPMASMKDVFEQYFYKEKRYYLNNFHHFCGILIWEDHQEYDGVNYMNFDPLYEDIISCTWQIYIPKNIPGQINFDGNMDLSIDALCLTARTKNCLKLENINYVSDLINTGKIDLLKLPNIGNRTIREIESALANKGLSLKE